jgi:hypothetical protein
MTAEWSLVSTMLGTPETVLPCVAHHLKTDAKLFHIYLDAPSPVLEAALASQPRCKVTVCDADYWDKNHGRRPKFLAGRQRANVAHARKTLETEWLVHVDSDEFLVARDPAVPFALSAELAKVPADHDWVRIIPMERVFPADLVQTTLFDGIFRQPTNDSTLVQHAYGAAAEFLAQGMAGHFRGKVGFRRGTEHTVRVHGLVRSSVIKPGKQHMAPEKIPPFTVLDCTRLLHFEGWTALHWVSRLVKFSEAGNYNFQRGRRASIKFMQEHLNPAERMNQFNRIQRLSPETMAKLAAAGLYRMESFDPSELTRKTFGDVDLDFSAASFDDTLRAASPDFYQRNGL